MMGEGERARQRSFASFTKWETFYYIYALGKESRWNWNDGGNTQQARERQKAEGKDEEEEEEEGGVRNKQICKISAKAP